MSSEEILSCISALRSGASDQIHQANSNLSTIMDNPTTVVNLLFIVRNQQDVINKHYASVLARVSLRYSESNFTPEQKNVFEFSILKIIQSENQPDLQKRLFDVAIYYLTHINPEWQNFWQIANELLQNAAMASISLHVWNNICCDSQRINPQYILHDFWNRFGGIIQHAFTSGDVELECGILDFISAVFDSYGDTDFVWPNEIAQLILTLFDKVTMSNPDLTVASKVFATLEFLLDNSFPPLDDLCNEIVQRICTIASTPDVEVHFRAAIQSLVSIIPWYSPDTVMEDIPRFLQPTIATAHELCQNDEYDINFVSILISSIINNLENPGEQVIGMLLEILQTGLQSQDGPSLLVAIFALDGAIESYGKDLEPHSADIMSAVATCLQSTFDSLFEAGCTLLLTCAHYCPDLYTSSLNSIIEVFLNQIGRQGALTTLDTVMFNSPVPPDNYMAIVTTLLGHFNLTDAGIQESLLSCLTSTISHVDEENVELYTGIRDFLFTILTADADSPAFGLKGKAFEMMGYLVKIAPQAVSAELPVILEVLCGSFSDNDELNEYLALCVSKLVEVLPQMLAPVIPDILNKYFELLAREQDPTEDDEQSLCEEEDAGDEIDEKFSPFSKMQATVLESIGAIIAVIPFSVDDSKSWIANGQGQHAVERFMVFLSNPAINIQTSAAMGLFIAGDGVPALVQPDVMKTMIGQLMLKFQQIIDQPTLASNVMLAMGGLFIHAVAAFSDEEFIGAISFFSQGFNKKLSGLMSGKKYDDVVIEQFFFAFRMFILYSGPRPTALSQLFDVIVPLFHSTRDIIQAYAFHTLCVLTYVYPQCDAARQLSLDAFLDPTNEIVKTIAFAGFSYLVTSEAQILIDQQAQNLLAASHNAALNSSSENLRSTAANLWCSIVVKYNIADPALIAALPSISLPPPIDDDDIPFAARFLFFAAGNGGPWAPAVAPIQNKTVLNILSSGEWCLKLIPQPILHWIASVAQTISDEEVAAQLKNNQHAILKFHRNRSGRF